MQTEYDETDSEAISTFADGLIGKTLREATGDSSTVLSGGRGDLGTLVEKLYFKITPPNDHLPDFAAAGMELKVTGVKQLKNGTIVPKERLVLSMINYPAVVSETFADSYLLSKIRLMLVLFYYYAKDVPVTELRFLAKKLWRLSPADLSLIEQDWQTIVAKVRAGKAHELSEGDTLYLGACTKSSDSTKRTKQPFSDIPAKPRAFSFKPSYMKVLLEEESIQKSLYDNLLIGPQPMSLEETVLKRLEPFTNRPVDELFNEYGPDIGPVAKNRFALLTNRLLGIKKQEISEFVKAGIIVKTIRLKQNGMPAEDMSFPAFNYEEIIKQTWDESAFKDVVESKFFFIVLQETLGGLKFIKGQFWNMPYEDRVEAERVWYETIVRIKAGKANDLPSKKFSTVAHIRPHGRNAGDTLPAPGGLEVVKKCFWLNASYLAEQLK
jgi:DNA mismatch repair protein MutH